MLAAIPDMLATLALPVPPAPSPGQRQPRFLNRIADAMQFRHSSRRTEQTHLREAGYDIRTIQELLGHKDVSTTMIYTHVLNKGGRSVRSPADDL
jgi:integrase